jgi:hypothetical protein
MHAARAASVVSHRLRLVCRSRSGPASGYGRRERAPARIEGWEISLSWFANSAGGGLTINARIAEALFDRDIGLGLNWIRYNIGGGDNPEYPKKIRWPENSIPGSLNVSGEYYWKRDALQRWMMKRAQFLGADLFEEISSSPPTG